MSENKYKEKNGDDQQEKQPQLRGAKKFFHMIFVKKWHPKTTINQTMATFAATGIVFLIFGIMIAIFNSTVIEKNLENYQNEENCIPIGNDSEKTCKYEFTIPSGDDMEPPVYMFYNLDNFYQNHRRYMKSKNSNQLSGEIINKQDAESCTPVIKNKDLGFPDNQTLEGGEQIGDHLEKIASPCGLIAKSFFNDEYELYSDQDLQNKIDINEKDIAWPDDKDKFQRPDKKTDRDLQWTDPSNEHFIVWMRVSGLPDFRKLWGKVEQKLEAGKTYYLKIYNIYDVEKFNGAKSIVFSTAGPLGGKNNFLSVAFIVCGVICIIIAIVFLFLKKFNSEEFKEKNR